MEPGIVPSFIARVRSGRISPFSSLYLIFDKGEDHFRYIRMLRSFFYFHIIVTKYCLSTPEMVYCIAAD